MKEWQRSLDMLREAIPPPAEPRFLDGPLLDPTLPVLPEDHAALIQAYGSGQFEVERTGCVIEIFNPRDPWHARQLRETYEILREYRDIEGDKRMPPRIYPESSGIFVCGWNESRDHWFWHMNGPDPNQWPTIFYGDMEDSFVFEMPMVVFMQKLFFGEISRRELGFGEPDYKPDGFTFRPSFRKGVPE